MNLLQLGLLLLSAAAAFVLAIGFLGRLHPAFDSFGHFRLHLAAILCLFGLLLLFTQFAREGVFALILALAAVAVTPGTSLNGLFAADAQADPGDDSAPVYRLLQFNGRYDNRTPGAFLSLVGRTRPDVITMQEVSSLWRSRLASLKAAYPHQMICEARSAVGSVAILSRRPFLEGTEPGCLDGGMFALATFDFGGNAVQVAAVHLYWPWPHEQPQQVGRLNEALLGVSNAAILAGDFNAARWSHTVRSMAAAAAMRNAGPIGPSWLPPRLPRSLRPWLGLGIDHILVGEEITPRRVQRLDHAGSDHLPVMLEFSIKHSEPSADRLTDIVQSGADARPETFRLWTDDSIS